MLRRSRHRDRGEDKKIFSSYMPNPRCRPLTAHQRSGYGGSVGRYFNSLAGPGGQTTFPGDPHEPHYSVQEIAKLWKVDAETVSKIFRDEPGVLVLGNIGRKDGKRNYTILRIPDSVLRRVYTRRTQKQSGASTGMNKMIRTRAEKSVRISAKPKFLIGG